ncbi:DcaP family trimeric outer membrane transporter [Flammeovirga sp. OC4]|uniref:DcaP family trimeric outer membrane transporter n=1 Tax=Flammeovirga sp. OC4 TaxID=1382345 RepID=UPI0005C5FADE|nr:DcaP family trimeric outer membrane transporter [Flammeovirga sp. OC4]
MNKITSFMKWRRLSQYFIIINCCLLSFQALAQEKKEDLVGVKGAINPLQMNARQLVGQELIDDAFPNSIPIFGSKSRIKFGGYVKMDYIQDFNYIGSAYEFESATIPIKGTPDSYLKGQSMFHAKETRFNVDFRTIVKGTRSGKEVPLQIFIEFDFFEDNPSLFRQPRLRHAYGVFGNILAGQTWSINADLSALPGIIDFSGGDGTYGDRVVQIRWTDKITKNLTYTVGMEGPKSSIDNPYELDGVARSTMPTFAGNVRWEVNKFSHMQLGADVFQHHWQGGQYGPTKKAYGYGINLTGRFVLDQKHRNSLMFGASTGKGSGHRIIFLEFSPSDGVISDNQLELLNAHQAYIGYNHYWTKSLNTTVAAYYAKLNTVDYQLDETTQQGGTFHANLVWMPYDNVSFGVEYMHGVHVVKDGRYGQANRLQFMTRFRIP